MNRVEATADVATDAQIGDDTLVWHLAQVRERAILGHDCVIGRGAYVGAGVRIGNHCKLQNYALVYDPAVLEDGVFIGPGAVLTNDQYPRSINPDGSPKSSQDWAPVGVMVRRGASIGARAVCIAPLTIGRWALVAAGSVVVKDVLDFALVAGVPAQRRAWVGKAGIPLKRLNRTEWVCPTTGESYFEAGGTLTESVMDPANDPFKIESE
ncbi:DapH/DapD/GlmU-related protein [Nakamurella sp. GG22]